MYSALEYTNNSNNALNFNEWLDGFTMPAAFLDSTSCGGVGESAIISQPSPPVIDWASMALGSPGGFNLDTIPQSFFSREGCNPTTSNPMPDSDHLFLAIEGEDDSDMMLPLQLQEILDMDPTAILGHSANPFCIPMDGQDDGDMLLPLQLQELLDLDLTPSIAPVDEGHPAAGLAPQHGLYQGSLFPPWPSMSSESPATLTIIPTADVTTTNKTFYDLTQAEIGTIALETLEQLMTAAGLTGDQQLEVKTLRKKMKNRASARGCSLKKKDQEQELVAQNGWLTSQLSQAGQHNAALMTANAGLTQQVAELRAVVRHVLQEREALKGEVGRLMMTMSGCS